MLKLVIGNKLYSSWSLRPWLVLSAFSIPFEEIVIPLRRPETAARLMEYSPSGKVPVLIDGDVTVWESLAIIEYLAEKFPDLPVWPRDGKARAHARAISSEMHAGFQALRQGCAMHLGARFATPPITDALRANVDRVEDIWSEARNRYGNGDGPFLYGAFSAADAMYARVSKPIRCPFAKRHDPIWMQPSCIPRWANGERPLLPSRGAFPNTPPAILSLKTTFD